MVENKRSFLARVILIPEKLTAWAAAGILVLCVQLAVYLTNLTGIDFTGISFDLFAAALATILAMVTKALLEKFVPESWHDRVNSFLEWLATFLTGLFVIKNFM